MVSSDLKQRLDSIAPEYYTCSFWTQYVQKCGEIVAPKVKDKTVLEMGCSTLVVSKMLTEAARRFDIVEGAASFARQGQRFFKEKVGIYHCLFEEFDPVTRYEAIVFTNTLHHLSNPREILLRIHNWLSPEGVLYITVPNMRSLHRQIGVEMGLLQDVCDATPRNKTYEQPGRYTKESLAELCLSCGYEVRDHFGFFLKPFSDEQMEQLNPSQALVDALFELGKTHEEMASLLYIELTAAD